MSRLFTVEGEIHRQYRRFNTEGTQLTVRLSAAPDEGDVDAITHFLDSMNDLFECALRDCNDSDMVGITVHKEVNEKDKPNRY
jgi:hypothetical protein